MADLYPPEVVARYWPKVDRSGALKCWEWTGGTRNHRGYGVFFIDGRTKMAHRVAYELMVGVIPAELTIDHLCRNRGCVNPAHMEVVTRGENGRRGNANRIYRHKTHCKRGHELAGDNEYIDKLGQRSCWQCRIARDRAARKGARLP